jgi:pimeloyl-ACP methyl ester carboxylesterase
VERGGVRRLHGADEETFGADRAEHGGVPFNHRREAQYLRRVEPFSMEVGEDQVADLRRRLGATRLPASAAAGEPWESGVDYDYLAGLIRYWAEEFDWSARRGYIESFPQFIADVDGQRIHFAQVTADRGAYATALPIVLSHGWPYSFLEMLPIVPRLTDPLSYGGSESDAFDVVVPSLPGYGFSPPLRGHLFTGDVIARLWHSLMAGTLGYERYATYGEDVGTTVSDWIGGLFPESVVGLFATHAAFPPEERSADLSEAESRFRSWLSDKWSTGRGYSQIQSTRPDTLAVGLTDSPAGLLAWLVEKFREWSGPGFEEDWSVDEILTTVSLYWFTESIGSSFLAYYHDRHETPIPMVDVPVGVAVQWGERGFPREYAERTYTDIRAWRELPRGGHFTAKQTPDLVAEAMREFFAPLRET